MSAIEPIETTVAHTGSDELRFHGRRVFGELLGHSTVGQMLMLGICGRMLAPEELAMVDDIITAMSSADPRMWPFKITRLASACGPAATAVATSLVAAQGGMFGPNRMSASARWLVELDSSASTDAEILAVIDRGSEAFGVTYRARDERYEALMRQVERRGRHELRFTALCRRAVALARDQRRLEPHVFVAIAAIALDAGIDIAAVGSLATLALFHDALANAIEGARQQPAILRELPRDRIDYRGHTPRTSPRAAAAVGGRSQEQ